MQDRYDTAFLGILQNEGEISKFLDSFFSFLYRKYATALLLDKLIGFHGDFETAQNTATTL